MTAIVPLPKSVRTLLRRNTHPGLMLDKFAESWDPDARGDGGFSERVQKPALDAVVRLSQQTPQGLSYEGLVQRRTAAHQAVGADVFHCRTAATLTLHLARASALENAGICLHPLYGFVYLPGSGLKGMTRAYAETVWFPAQYDADANGKPKNEAELQKAAEAWQTIEATFGWAPNSDARKSWKPDSIARRRKNEREHAGQVIFHDAWPTTWPKLIVDILNNHHADYYRGEGAPGDWENPVPVYFLAVEPGQTFEFAIAKRRSDVPDALLDQARQWLVGALCHLGAGAKTNAGYGVFQPVEGPRPALVSPRHATFEATLELVTPAFLAGADQQEGDCDLRPATLRGLLRWWWRTMHAGFVDVDTLRAMEAAIWGDTKRGGAVRITIEPIRKIDREPYDKRQLAINNRLPRPANKSTSQGLWYQSYGMDEKKGGVVQRRHFVAPGAQWRLSISCSDWSRDERGEQGRLGRVVDFSAQKLIDQVQASLWLLCHCGGVGAKCRKGFGSFADPAELRHWSWEQIEAAAISFRDQWRSIGLAYSQGDSNAASLSDSQHVEIATPWTNPWFALDQLGACRQAFAQASSDTGHGKHCPAKAALGLPRNIHKAPAEKLVGPMGERYASSVIFHLTRSTAGGLDVRAIVFHPARLWAKRYHNEQTGPRVAKDTLQKFMDHFRRDMAARVKRHPDSSPPQASRRTPAPQAANPVGSAIVRVKVLGKNEKLNNAYFVQEEGKARGELRFGKPPADQAPPEPGDVLKVYRHNNDARSPLYRWDPPGTQQAPRRSQGRGGPPRRR